jgi:hypothetical protein
MTALLWRLLYSPLGQRLHRAIRPDGHRGDCPICRWAWRHVR